jgi:hypothetical protein
MLYGHIPDDHTPERWTPLEALVGAAPAPAPPESPGLVAWADRVENQPGCSCVGHGIAGGIYAKEGAANAAAGQPGRVRVFPAPLPIYYNARAKGGYPKIDKGCQPLLAFEGLTDYGYCAIEDWPSNDNNILRQPGAEVYRRGADQRVIQYYRIVNDGEEACEDVRQAVSKENPVTLALQVDLSFEKLKDAVWTGPQGKIVGGHYVWVVEYNVEYVTICNSWSRNWGMSGFGKVSWRAIANAAVTRDRYAITFAPTPAREAA